MRKFCFFITALSSLSFGDTTTVTGKFEWIDSLPCVTCTIEKVLIVTKAPGQFEVGAWNGGPNDLQGTCRVNNAVSSLPVSNSILLHVNAPMDTVRFVLKPQKPGTYFIRFTPDESTAITPRKPQAARSPFPWGKGASFSILGRWMPAQAPR